MSFGTPSTDSQGDFGRLRLAYFSNEFPHDNLQHLLRLLWTHSKDRRHPLLANFIDDATLAIREEIRRLPAVLKALIPPFQTIFNLTDSPELRKGPLSGSIDGVLLASVELAVFIGYALRLSYSQILLLLSGRWKSCFCSIFFPSTRAKKGHKSFDDGCVSS